MGTLGVRIGVTVNCKQRHSQAFFSEGARGGGHGFSVGGGAKVVFFNQAFIIFWDAIRICFIYLFVFIYFLWRGGNGKFMGGGES